MVIAELLCSDECCAVAFEIVAGALDELDVLLCDECECTLQTLSISDVEPVELERPVVLLSDLARAA